MRSETAEPETDASLASCLRRETRSTHDRVESSAFARRVAQGRLDLPTYVAYLRTMQSFHDGVESLASASTDTHVRRLWREDMRRVPHINDDLVALARYVSGISPIIRSDPFAAFSGSVGASPKRLIGLLYVAEGSRLGGRVIAQRLRAAYPDLGRGGLDYLTGCGVTTGEHWAHFRRSLDRLSLDDGGTAAALDGARLGFDAIAVAFAGLGS